jgi:hypothetical protein
MKPIDRMKEYEDKFGALYNGLVYEEKPEARLVTVFFVFKRVGFVLSSFYLKFELIQCFLVVQFFNLVYLFAVQPFDDKLMWKTQVFNEMTVWLVVLSLNNFKGDLY